MEHEELKEFAQKVKTGQITDFEPHFQNQNPDQLRSSESWNCASIVVILPTMVNWKNACVAH